jgi:ParE toxin of type II toxin-antitoxin system, parDE
VRRAKISSIFNGTPMQHSFQGSVRCSSNGIPFTRASPPMSDLEAIADYIAQDNPSRAVSFIREIRDELPLVGQIPLLHQLRPEIGEDARLASSAATWSCRQTLVVS